MVLKKPSCGSQTHTKWLYYPFLSKPLYKDNFYLQFFEIPDCAFMDTPQLNDVCCSPDRLLE